MAPFLPFQVVVRSPVYPHCVRGDTVLSFYFLLRMVRTVALQGILAVYFKLSVRDSLFTMLRDMNSHCLGHAMLYIGHKRTTRIVCPNQCP